MHLQQLRTYTVKIYVANTYLEMCYVIKHYAVMFAATGNDASRMHSFLLQWTTEITSLAFLKATN